MNKSNTKARLAFIKFNFQNGISQNTGKCKLSGFLLRESHIVVVLYHTVVFYNAVASHSHQLNFVVSISALTAHALFVTCLAICITIFTLSE